MSFDVHPPAGSGPLALPAGTPGPLEAFDEHSEIDPASGRNLMYVGVVQINEGDGRTAAPPPEIRLAVGSEQATRVDAAATPIRVTPGAESVAVASLRSEPNDVHLVEIEVLHRDVQWHIQLVNTDSLAHRYTYVIASTKAGTRQPWLDIPSASVTFEAVTGESIPPESVPIANYGAGPLDLADLDGADLGSGFLLVDVAPRPIGGNGRGNARITFTASGSPGSPAVSHVFASDDPAAGLTAGHSNELALGATVRPRRLWAPGDVLVLEEATLARLDKTSGNLIPVTSDAAGSLDVAVDPSTGDAVLLGSGFVKRVDRFTGQQRSVPGFQDVVMAGGLDVQPDGTIVICETESITRISPAGSISSVGTASVIANPEHVAIDSNGNLVEAHVGGVVRVSSSMGAVFTVASGGELAPQFAFGAAVAVERDGTILAAINGGFSPGGGVSVSFAHLVRVNPQNGHQVKMTSLDTNTQDLAVAADGTILAATNSGVLAVNPGTGDRVQLTPRVVRRIAAVPTLAS